MTTQSARKRIWRYLPLLLWMVFIYLASTSGFSATNTSRFLRPLLVWVFPEITEDRIAILHFLIRKTAHFTEYAILAFLAGRAFLTSSHQLVRHNWFRVALLLVVTSALLDEFHQSLVRTRTASIYDCLIDIAGGLFVLICLWYRNEPPRRAAQSSG